MKIIYVGGYTDKNNSHFIDYKNFVQEFINDRKQVLFVALGKDPGYFTSRIKDLYPNTPYILDISSPKEIVWGSYDLIYIIGGNTQQLTQNLSNFGFDLEKLKKGVVLLGDSAGANVLSKYYIGKDSNGYTLEQGLNPQSNILVLCHCDNPEKTPQNKIEIAKKYAESKEARLVLLNENESVIIDSKD